MPTSERMIESTAYQVLGRRTNSLRFGRYTNFLDTTSTPTGSYPINCMYTVRESDIVDNAVVITKRMVEEFKCSDG